MGAVPRPGRAQAAVLPQDAGRVRGLLITRTLPSGRALLLGFTLLAGGALAYVGARESSLFALRSIQISGAPPRVAAHVRAALEPLAGRSLLAVNRGDVERRLAGLSDVAGVSFDRDFPHTLRVFVSPAHSIAVLRRGASAWIVSSDGRVIRTAGLFGARKLPRIWIPRSAAVDVGMTVGDANTARAVQALATARRAGFGKRIAAVRSTDRELTFVLAAGPELRLGDATSVALKLAVAKRVLPFVTGVTGYIDVTIPARPITGGKPQVAGLG
jgi:cell division septal protein FtsQ